MATSATRQTVITFTGDVTATEVLNAATNAASAGQIQVVTLASGANTITVPTGGTVPTAVTIVPPAANAVAITLKGVSGDGGIALHLTDHTVVALAASVTTFVINAGSTLTGLRLIWS